VADDFLDARLTERRNPRSATIDTASALEIVDLISAEDATVPTSVARARVEIARTIDLIEGAFRAGGRLIYVGAGTSGRLGVLDAAECPPTFGTPPDMVVGLIAGGLPALIRSIEGAEDDVNAGLGEMDARKVGPNDVVVGIAASGTTPFVRAALSRAQTLGARTALVSCSEPPALLQETCDVCITVLVGPEIVTGSTRMKSGTATKLVLNMLTTGAMIRLGKTYGNLMVDLRAWNDKLVDRSQRIVMETTGLGRDEARSVLAAADGSVKTAIVMARRRVGREEAERLLAESAGHLRSVIGDPPPVRPT
jgi:N-acetylmuramic acid 6-phosphate etherase